MSDFREGRRGTGIDRCTRCDSERDSRCGRCARQADSGDAGSRAVAIQNKQSEKAGIGARAQGRGGLARRAMRSGMNRGQALLFNAGATRRST
jgi:hypothetical protein